MPKLLTTASNAKCAHGGSLKLSTSQSKLKVAGSAVVLQTDVPGTQISGCSIPNQSGPPPTKPCMTVTSMLSGASTKVRVNGVPAVLETAQGLTDGISPAPGTWSVQSAGHQAFEAS